MDDAKLFDHFYDQYRAQMAEADFVYRCAGFWLSADTLLGGILAALATGGPSRRLALDVTLCPVATLCVLAGITIVASIGAMAFSLKFSEVGRFSLPHEILKCRDDRRHELEQAAHPKELWPAAETATVYTHTLNVLAASTRGLWEVNQRRRHRLMLSSNLSLIATALVVVLLTWAVINTGLATNAARAVSQKENQLNDSPKTESSAPQPSPSPAPPPTSTTLESGTQTRTLPPPSRAPLVQPPAPKLPASIRTKNE